jgi:pyroglutamyl-peptidase
MSLPPRIRVAVAGFGPFPGVPKNPSGEIVRALAKMQRFRAAGIGLDTAIFETAYGAAESALEKLIARKPDAIVLFGVAGGARHVRVETIARNRASVLHPDHARFTPRTRKLSAEGNPLLKVRGPAMHMRAAIRASGTKAELSINAGSYLCNAVFYRALAATVALQPAPLTFFIHVPPLRAHVLSMKMLIRAGEAAVWAAANEAAKTRIVPRRDV